jgi:hypothetical protein
MSDDWSLKGKYNLVEGMFLCTEKDWKTLRKKLIEDIMYYNRYNREHGRSHRYIEPTIAKELIKNINKRFGVEE